MSKAKQTEPKRRGRPVNQASKRQMVLSMRQEKQNMGIEIKRGRPKLVKQEE